jgi:hypothetical protein
LLSIDTVKLIAIAVKRLQRQSISLKYRRKISPLLLALQQGLQVCMRSTGPITRANFQRGKLKLCRRIRIVFE